ncbi:50S ribosomal protein L19 [Neoehrlichia mikurensis]|uniref:Large ribosomal subunit protein bL19 n=1 Tax=Neoehrlichia mikurensis TaxID=89586 RepID=A0A9Q9C149_9RICK|nr:50S ribosomal protein L19 [Neoehrlichia mikurensis]QXK92340.1 50S ribosomal protein L19 [Neoehrlichia mikurensis]QXK92794.1 50S ribosomal protein L19 [Neoehrlichia mikurensis]QXK94035.1 50S ribosomal protein L19 [Neoehrlichia mikurensis]UTO55800.1 50S ribosomal protein L19 [Neoehrlichia mikurensis]UTO56714.1 50S ribosomal protein L19 [Neoehrlichia mikurensis]
MNKMLKDFNDQQMKLLSKAIPDFRPGDTLKVTIRVSDGLTDRNQTLEGVCIKKRNKGLHSSFTLRKVSHGESIQIQIFLFSPTLHSIEVIKLGKVRRAKLYYMLSLFGKSARIKERNDKLRKTS